MLGHKNNFSVLLLEKKGGEKWTNMFAQFADMSTILQKETQMEAYPLVHPLKNFQATGHALYVVQVKTSLKNRRIS
jgi:hypothetical protein